MNSSLRSNPKRLHSLSRAGTLRVQPRHSSYSIVGQGVCAAFLSDHLLQGKNIGSLALPSYQAHSSTSGAGFLHHSVSFPAPLQSSVGGTDDPISEGGRRSSCRPSIVVAKGLKASLGSLRTGRAYLLAFVCPAQVSYATEFIAFSVGVCEQGRTAIFLPSELSTARFWHSSFPWLLSGQGKPPLLSSLFALDALPYPALGIFFGGSVWQQLD